MNKLIIFLLLAFSISCKTNRYTKESSSKEKKYQEAFIKQFSDSIDAVSKGGAIPSFLSDPDFDYKYIAFNKANHLILPKRKMIVDHVKSCESLKKILDMRIPQHMAKPKAIDNLSLKYIDKSFYELMEQRYRERKCD